MRTTHLLWTGRPRYFRGRRFSRHPDRNGPLDAGDRRAALLAVPGRAPFRAAHARLPATIHLPGTARAGEPLIAGPVGHGHERRLRRRSGRRRQVRGRRRRSSPDPSPGTEPPPLAGPRGRARTRTAAHRRRSRPVGRRAASITARRSPPAPSARPVTRDRREGPPVPVIEPAPRPLRAPRTGAARWSPSPALDAWTCAEQRRLRTVVRAGVTGTLPRAR